MSHQAVNAVLAHSKAGGSDRLVLVVLAHHADRDTFECHPSRELLCRETAMSPRNLVYCLNRLEATQELVINRGGGRGRLTTYQIQLERVQNPVETLQPPAPFNNERVQPSAPFEDEKGCNPASERVQSTVKKGAKSSGAYKDIEQAWNKHGTESMQQQRESRFSAERITQYIKATKQHVYSISGLTRYLKSNAEEDELIAKWIEAEELKEKLKTNALENAANLEKTFPWDEWINNLIHFNDRAHLEMERKLIAERGGPKEPWEFRVYEYLNAATEAA